MVKACLTVHLCWPVSPHGASLTLEIRGRIAPYLTRYGQTLGATVFAVGGTNNHLHVLLNAPVNRPLDQVIRELQTASERFVRETLNEPEFVWHDEGFAASVGANAVPALSGYIQDNEAFHASGAILTQWEFDALSSPHENDEPMPAWLADALQSAGTKTR